jgi:hypothetical protein
VNTCRRETFDLLIGHLPITVSCTLSGVPRSSFYRRRRPVPGIVEQVPRPTPPNALSEAEREELVAVLNSGRFADKAPRQVWATLLDEGVHLASVSTMCRELRARHQVRERRAHARHEARKKPYLVARAPNEIWTWDITKLQGPGKREFYELYVMLDIFSRHVVHWEVHLREAGELAEQFMQNSFIANGGIVPGTIHSDNGTSMTSSNPTRGRRSATTTPTARHSSEPSSTARCSRRSSSRSTRRKPSATISSSTTITSTTIPGLACTCRSLSTSERRKRSRTNEPRRSNDSGPPTRSGSPAHPSCPRSQPRPTSTSPRSRARPAALQRQPPSDLTSSSLSHST